MKIGNRTRLGAVMVVAGLILTGGCVAIQNADPASGAAQATEPPPPHPELVAAEPAPMDEYAFLPAGEGRDTTIRLCSACHGLDLISHQRLSRQEWFEMVQFMVDRGAMGTPAELAEVTDYLAEHFPAG